MRRRFREINSNPEARLMGMSLRDDIPAEIEIPVDDIPAEIDIPLDDIPEEIDPFSSYYKTLVVLIAATLSVRVDEAMDIICNHFIDKLATMVNVTGVEDRRQFVNDLLADFYCRSEDQEIADLQPFVSVLFHTGIEDTEKLVSCGLDPILSTIQTAKFGGITHEAVKFLLRAIEAKQYFGMK